MLAYNTGYARLTSLNKSLLRQHFEDLSLSEKTEELRLFGGVGRLPRIQVSRSALSVVGGLLALSGLLYVLYGRLR